MTWNLIRLVLMPVKSAAIRLPPVASTWRPKRVFAKHDGADGDEDRHPDEQPGNRPEVAGAEGEVVGVGQDRLRRGAGDPLRHARPRSPACRG